MDIDRIAELRAYGDAYRCIEERPKANGQTSWTLIAYIDARPGRKTRVSMDGKIARWPTLDALLWTIAHKGLVSTEDLEMLTVEYHHTRHNACAAVPATNLSKTATARDADRCIAQQSAASRRGDRESGKLKCTAVLFETGMLTYAQPVPKRRTRRT